ncbi:MAG: CoA transferase, partial [Deltaproteobacteria bacterium]|nr:CoA transferase [Deltaproteobacteria bacterium]
MKKRPYLPLEGIVVVDFSRFLPGPLCTLYLAELGARVVKIEEPTQGDYTRHIPPLLGHHGSYFTMLNRDKESIGVNLKADEGQEVARRLISKADVLIENFRPGVMKKLGLDYETLSHRSPRLIYCSITGFGQEGPWSHLAGHDPNYAALSGILDTIGSHDAPPTFPGVQIADLCGGTFPAAIAILGALLYRERSGEGTFLDISMTDGSIAAMIMLLGAHFATGRDLKRGSEYVTGKIPQCSAYRTADNRYMAVVALEEKFWRRFCKVMGIPEWKDCFIDSEKAQDPDKLKVLRQTLERRFAEKPLKEWVKIFEKEDACASPILTTTEALNSSHVKHRELIFYLEKDGFKIPQVALPTGRKGRTTHTPPP